MGKIGILTSLLLMVFALLERTTFIFSIGFSLFLLSALKEFLPKTWTRSFKQFIGTQFTLAVEHERRKHQEELSQAEDWLQRYALRSHRLLRSNYCFAANGNIRAERNSSEYEEGEDAYEQFHTFLFTKGIHLSDRLTRLYINHYIMLYRTEQLSHLLHQVFEEPPTLSELLQRYADEELRIERSSSVREFWNLNTLLYLIEQDYEKQEIKLYFPKWPRAKKEQLEEILQHVQSELMHHMRLNQLEEWLLGSPLEGSKVLSLTYLDHHVEQYQEFRAGMVSLLERLGYKISLPMSTHTGVDLMIERSGIRFGVLLRPLAEGKSITTHLIHEAHTIRTLADLTNVMIITNRSFTPSALELANKLEMISIHREHIEDWLKKTTNPYQQLGS